MAPAYQQRATAVAGLSFVFFLAMMIAYYARGHYGYFLLSTAFLVVFAFTMAGWWMQRRNVVELYDRGVVIRKFMAKWDDIAAIERKADGHLKLITIEHESALIPRTIYAIDVLETYLRERCCPQHSS